MGIRNKFKNRASKLVKRALNGRQEPHELRITPKRPRSSEQKQTSIVQHSSERDKIESLKTSHIKPEQVEQPSPKKKKSASAIKKKFELAKAGPLVEENHEAVKEQIIAELRTVHDPEIPVNIYDLGLIYNIEIGTNRHVDIEMTLTSPGCPVAQTLVDEVKKKAEGADEIMTAEVKLVWEPAWAMEMMSEEAQLELDML